MKKDALIQNEFNCQSMENPRTANILKNKYDNIKRSVKKQYADEIAFHSGTGGGPTKAFPVTSLAMTVGEMLQVKITGETSIFDFDVSIAPVCEPELGKHEGYGNELIDDT